MLSALIGAAAGGLGSLFGGSKQTSSTMPDAQTQQIRDAIFQQGQGMASDPRYQGILSGYGGFSDLTQMGIGGMSGDPAAFGRFMNPYLDNVLKRSNEQFDILGNKAQNLVNDQATKAGAFGGSRAAVASGVAAGQVANERANANTNLLYGGYNDAQNRAAQAAQLGLQGNNQYLNALGFPSEIMARGLPGGGSTTTTSQGGGGVGGFISGALGGAAVGGGLFGGASGTPNMANVNPGGWVPSFGPMPVSRFGIGG